MAYYKDIREYLEALDRKGKLRRITCPINKDTELVPLVSLQFRGLPEDKRSAFVFDNITDVKGRHYRGQRGARRAGRQRGDLCPGHDVQA